MEHLCMMSHMIITKPQIAIVVAMSRNRTIGINNTLPWRCPEDLKHFKSLTIRHHIIMGRKTFDSIGKPLEGRITVVISRNYSLKIEGCIVVNSLEQAIASCGGNRVIFIVGGTDIFTQALHLADMMYVTEIQMDVEGDAHFPDFDKSLWVEIERNRRWQESPEPLAFAFVKLKRKMRLVL